MSSEKRRPKRQTNAAQSHGDERRTRSKKKSTRKSKPAEPEGISTLGKYVIAGGAVLALLLLTGVGFLIRHLVNKSAFEDAVANERWTEVLEYDPTHGKALVNLAKAKLAETPPNVSAAFEYIDRIPSDEPDTDSYVSPRGLTKPLIQTVRANAYAHRAAAAAVTNPDEALDDYNEALSNKADMSLLTPVRGKLVSVLLGQALSFCDEGEDNAAVEQLQQAFTLDQTGPSTVIKFDAKPDGQIPLRLSFLEFTSKVDAYFDAPDVDGLNGFCEDIEKFFMAAAGVDRSLFGTGRFNASAVGYGGNTARGNFIENAEKWEAKKEQFAARMHDMSAGFFESDFGAAMKTWKLAERIVPNSSPTSLKDGLAKKLTQDFRNAMSADRASAGPPLVQLMEVDQNYANAELRNVIRQMQTFDDLNNLLVDISKGTRGTSWPRGAREGAASHVQRVKKNTNAPALIQAFDDTRGINTTAGSWLVGRPVVLVWEPNPNNKPTGERILHSLEGKQDQDGLVFRGQAKMVASVRAWLESDTQSNSDQPWLTKCHRLYVCGRIAAGADRFRTQFQKTEEPKGHLATFYVNRIIASVAPSHPNSGDTNQYALTGRLLTGDGEHDLLIHDVLLGNSVARLGHPAMPLLSGVSESLNMGFLVGQQTSGRAPGAFRADGRGFGSTIPWPDAYLQRLATADVNVLQRESRKAAEVTSAILESGGVLDQDYAKQQLTKDQKSNLQKGKRLRDAVKAISDGSDSWLADLNEYKDAYAGLAGEAEETDIAKSLAQQWQGVTTPNGVAIVSLEDVIPAANKLVAAQQEELKAAKEASKDGEPNTGATPSDLRYWPSETFAIMTSGTPPLSQRYATALRDAERLAIEAYEREREEQKRLAELEKKVKAQAKANAQARASWKIDKSKPYIYVIVRPGTWERKDWNRVVVTVQNGTKNRISVVTQVKSNIMGDLFVDALTLNIPSGGSKQSNSSWDYKAMLTEVWQKRSYTLSCDVTGAPSDVQCFYAVPDEDFGRYSTRNPGSKLMPISELRRQFGE